MQKESTQLLNKKFNVKMRGYACADVDAYLSEVASKMEMMEAREDELKSALNDANSQLSYLRGIENALRDAMVTAQQSAIQVESEARSHAEETVAQAQEEASALTQEAQDKLDQAQSEADRIIAQANEQAERILADAREQADQTLNQTMQRREAMEAQIGDYRTKIRELMASQLDSIERILGE